eukprot:COSAG01_NODE_5518_length_4207_cov_14.979796_2_plen_169_part_00
MGPACLWRLAARCMHRPSAVRRAVRSATVLHARRVTNDNTSPRSARPSLYAPCPYPSCRRCRHSCRAVWRRHRRAAAAAAAPGGGVSAAAAADRPSSSAPNSARAIRPGLDADTGRGLMAPEPGSHKVHSHSTPACPAASARARRISARPAASQTPFSRVPLVQAVPW